MKKKKTENDSNTLMDKLDVDKGLAEALIEQGYRSWN